jgi:leader peptidase (prepilin peptidase) / N-methyltransferase
MTSVILFVLGAIVGSFLNVLALRFNSGLTLWGRSHCSSCSKVLGALELVPILGFLFLGGRCRDCKARVSFQYPLVELGTGLVFVTIFNPVFSLIQNILLLAVFCLYIAITIYDFRHQIIPDGLVYTSILLAGAFRFFSGGETLDYWAGPILALLFAAVWLITRGRAMGFGDSKLALSIGLLLGASVGFSSVILAFWIGASCGIFLILISRIYPLLSRGKGFTIKSAIPFAPFLVLGAWLGQVFQMDLLHVSLFQL